MNLGEFGFDIKSEDFIGIILHGNKEYSLVLCDLTENEIEKARILANKICEWWAENIETAKKYIVSVLIKLKNDSWLQEAELPITEQAFNAAIGFSGITAFSD